MSNNALLGGQGDEFNFGGHMVRVTHEDDEYLIPATDVARALGYDNPKVRAGEVIRRHSDDFDGLTRKRNLRSRAGNGVKTTCITEQGVYVFCMLARTDKAKEFRRTVAAHLQAVRRLRHTGQVEASLLQAVMPVLQSLVAQATDVALSSALHVVNRRQAAVAKEVARTKERLGTLERTAKVLNKRPLQLVIPTDDVEEFLPTALVSLKERRQLRGWTQAQTATCLGISRSHYSQIEEGLRQPPAWLRKQIEELFLGR